MKKILLNIACVAICMYLCTALPSLAMSASIADGDSLNADLEVVNLAALSAELSRLDIYVKVLYDDLQFIKATSDSFAATYAVNMKILTEGEEVDSRDFKDRVVIKSLDEANSRDKFKMSRVTFVLPPEEYDLQIRVEDTETNRFAVQNSEVKLRDFSGDDLLVSDILFLDDVTRNDDGKLVFQPRVSDVQNSLSRILVYFEVYNVPDPDSFKVEYEVVSAEDELLVNDSYWSQSSGRITQNFVDIQGETLRHGRFRTKIEVKYGGEKRKIEKSFNWYLEGLPRFFANIDDAIEVLKYLTSDEEYKHLRNLEEQDKYREFISFWNRHDPTPLTSENELLDEYYARVAFANERFGQMGKAGWKTDRGWVYVLLGEPDAINRNPFNVRGSSFGRPVKAIEVWDYYHYNRQLVFFDTNGFGDYRLENRETLYEILR